jgi:hypothetical protein
MRRIGVVKKEMAMKKPGEKKGWVSSKTGRRKSFNSSTGKWIWKKGFKRDK